MLFEGENGGEGGGKEKKGIFFLVFSSREDPVGRGEK